MSEAGYAAPHRLRSHAGEAMDTGAVLGSRLFRQRVPGLGWSVRRGTVYLVDHQLTIGGGHGKPSPAISETSAEAPVGLPCYGVRVGGLGAQMASPNASNA